MDTLAHSVPHEAAARRRAFTADDLERMTRQGIIADSERVELIGGDIVAMAAKGNFHEIVRNALTFSWARKVPDGFLVYGETPLRLSERDNPEPDIIVFPAALALPDVRGDTVLLVVETADTSLGYDLGIKSGLYAHFGVREYWVIDAPQLVTHVHRAPVDGQFTSVIKHAAADLVTPLDVPLLASRLADFGFDWAA